MFVLARFWPALGLMWKPDRHVVMPPTCHPPAMASRNEFFNATFRPFPNGTSQRPERTILCRLSNAERPRSQNMQRPSCENSESLSEVRIPLVVSIDFDQV